MKANAKELFEVVRQVVHQEVKKMLPELINKHLTETYIKKIVAESSRPAQKNKSPALAELLSVNPEVDQEEIPSPLKNTDLGIYANTDLGKKEKKNESVEPRRALLKNSKVQELAKELGPLAFVLEDVKIPGEESDMPDVPLDTIQPDFERMNRLVEATNNVASSHKEMQQTAEAKMRELERKRAALDVPASQIRR